MYFCFLIYVFNFVKDGLVYHKTLKVDLGLGHEFCEETISNFFNFEANIVHKYALHTHESNSFIVFQHFSFRVGIKLCANQHISKIIFCLHLSYHCPRMPKSTFL